MGGYNTLDAMVEIGA